MLEMGGGGEKKRAVQLNSLVGINPHPPALGCPAGQQSTLRDGKRKIPQTSWDGGSQEPSVPVSSSVPTPSSSLFLDFHSLDSPEKARTPHGTLVRGASQPHRAKLPSRRRDPRFPSKLEVKGASVLAPSSVKY